MTGALIFLDGDYHPNDLPSRERKATSEAGQRFPIVVCADGGLKNALKAGLTPTAVVGDFDSVGRVGRSDAGTPPYRVISYPVAKDKTDGQLAVEYAIGVGARELFILGALGGRFDHTLTNLGFLSLAHRLGARAEIVDRHHRILYAPEGVTRFRAGLGQTVSLVPVGDVCRGITTSGLAYALKDGELKRWSSRGNSNVAATEDVEIQVGEGALWVVLVAPGDRAAGVTG